MPRRATIGRSSLLLPLRAVACLFFTLVVCVASAQAATPDPAVPWVHAFAAYGEPK